MVILRGDTLYDSGEYEKGSSGMTVKVRGNSSAWSDKHPFKLKLQRKADLLLRGDARYDDRDWVLLYESPYTLCNLVSRQVCAMLGMDYVPCGEYVNLLFNGDYRGLYFLSESVGRNPLCRIDVDSDEGYIIELDAYWWNEDVWFETLLTEGSPFRRYTFKYPDPDDVTEGQVEYIRTVMSCVEQSIMDGSYPAWIDVDSFVSWILAHDILGTWDSMGSNTFLTKHDSSDSSKVRLGPPWDFDTVMMMGGEWSRIHDMMLFPWFWGEGPDGQFTRSYYMRLEDARGWLFDAMADWAGDFLETETARGVDRSRSFDSARWDIEYRTVEEDVERIRDWFQTRKDWAGYTVSIPTPRQESVSRPSAVYDLQGHRIKEASHHGVYIRGSRKYVK
ncbi:MAG: CotH kinase family protein [Prevotella sp.]|nr:CotH kinase family protein [Prevotella sp.]